MTAFGTTGTIRLVGAAKTSLFAILVALLLAASISSAAMAASPKPDKGPSSTKGKLDYLAAHVGTMNAEGVLTDPYVETALKRHLGADYATVMRIMEKHGPVNLLESDITIMGGNLFDPALDAAIVSVDTFKGRVHVAYRTGGSAILYIDERYYAYLPIPFKEWLVILAQPELFQKIAIQPPPGLIWKSVQ